MLKDIRKLKRIKRIATKMAPGIKNLPFEDRLEEMEPSTLKGKQEREDLITMYKLVNNIKKID